MARFVFKLAAAYELRRREEQAAQRGVAERQRDANQLRQELMRLNDDLVGAQQDLRDGGLTGTLDPSLLSAHRRYTNDVARRGRDVMQRIDLADRLLDDARRALAEKTRRRQALERLRDKQKQEHDDAEQRRELADADDATGRWLDGLRAQDAIADDAGFAMAAEEVSA
ncbi:MAG: flagellar export protein FliJ [Planctomycetota bacterium]